MRNFFFTEKILRQYESVILEINKLSEVDRKLRHSLHSAHNLSNNKEFLDNLEKLRELSNKKKTLEDGALECATKIMQAK